ncbi:hypothetical protein QUF72_07335 [Desulfobacterales bacterium HSG2]|nr:hypothetical protein [Desulfobacterales bacterium HSG2]
MFFLIFIYISTPGYIFAEDKSSDTIDLDFEIPEAEKKPYSFNAEIKISETIRGFDKDSLLFNQKYPNSRDDGTFFQTDLNLRAEGSYEIGIVKLYARLSGELYYNNDEDWENGQRTEEAYVSLLPSPSLTLDIGKKVSKWGKGYAWNPAAFFSRPKDIEDPDATQEGYYVVSGDLIKSTDSPLRTIALTPVILPVSEDINDKWGNDERGTERDILWGGKIYFFAFDTDMDIMFLAGEKVEDRFGADFSKNISVNFEIHGEAAIVLDYVRYVTDQQGNLTQKKYNAKNYLLGIRYLTSHDTTYIFEYFRNGQGYTRDEMKDYFTLVEDGYKEYVSTQTMAKLSESRQYGHQFYNRQTVMKDYLYLKVSQKEPYDILYFTPSVACIYNVNDKSGSIIPQITYTPITNFEFEFKTTFLLGKDYAEYGEKLNDYKVYAAVRYYF